MRAWSHGFEVELWQGAHHSPTIRVFTFPSRKWGKSCPASLWNGIKMGRKCEPGSSLRGEVTDHPSPCHQMAFPKYTPLHGFPQDVLPTSTHSLQGSDAGSPTGLGCLQIPLLLLPSVQRCRPWTSQVLRLALASCAWSALPAPLSDCSLISTSFAPDSVRT